MCYHYYMKYKFVLPTPYKIILTVLSVAEIFAMLYYVAKILQLFNLAPGSITLDFTAIVIFALSTTLSIGFLTMRYVVKDGKLSLYLLFFNVLGQVETAKILNVVYKKSQGKVYFSKMLDHGDPQIYAMQLAQKDVENFVETLKGVNPTIIYTEED